MGYKLSELLEAKEHNGCTPTGVKTPNEYKGLKNCAHCENEFIVNQLKPGREPLYCSKRCKVAAYVKRKGINEQHPLAEMQGLKGGIDERYLAQINELKAQVEELKEAQKTQAEAQKAQAEKLRDAQIAVNNTILKKIAALKDENTNILKETSLQPQKTPKITTKGVGVDIATSATGALIAKEVRDFFTKWENKPVTKGELELLQKRVHRWFKEIKTDIVEVKAQQKRKLFY